MSLKHQYGSSSSYSGDKGSHGYASHGDKGSCEHSWKDGDKGHHHDCDAAMVAVITAGLGSRVLSSP